MPKSLVHIPTTLTVYGTAQMVEAKQCNYKDFDLLELQVATARIICKQKYLIFEWSLIRFCLLNPDKIKKIGKHIFEITPKQFTASQLDIELYLNNPKFLFRFSLATASYFEDYFFKPLQEFTGAPDLVSFNEDTSAMVPYIEKPCNNTDSFWNVLKKVNLNNNLFKPEDVKKIKVKYIQYSLSVYDTCEVFYSDDFVLHQMDTDISCFEFAECLLTGLRGSKKLPLLIQLETAKQKRELSLSDGQLRSSSKTNNENRWSSLKNPLPPLGTNRRATSLTLRRGILKRSNHTPNLIEKSFLDDLPDQPITRTALEYLGESDGVDPAKRLCDLLAIAHNGRKTTVIKDHMYTDSNWIESYYMLSDNEFKEVYTYLKREIGEHCSVNSFKNLDSSNKYYRTGWKISITVDIKQNMLARYWGNCNEGIADSTTQRIRDEYIKSKNTKFDGNYAPSADDKAINVVKKAIRFVSIDTVLTEKNSDTNEKADAMFNIQGLPDTIEIVSTDVSDFSLLDSLDAPVKNVASCQEEMNTLSLLDDSHIVNVTLNRESSKDEHEPSIVDFTMDTNIPSISLISNTSNPLSDNSTINMEPYSDNSQREETIENTLHEAFLCSSSKSKNIDQDALENAALKKLTNAIEIELRDLLSATKREFFKYINQELEKIKECFSIEQVEDIKRILTYTLDEQKKMVETEIGNCNNLVQTTVKNSQEPFIAELKSMERESINELKNMMLVTMKGLVTKLRAEMEKKMGTTKMEIVEVFAHNLEVYKNELKKQYNGLANDLEELKRAHYEISKDRTTIRHNENTSLLADSGSDAEYVSCTEDEATNSPEEVVLLVEPENKLDCFYSIEKVVRCFGVGRYQDIIKNEEYCILDDTPFLKRLDFTSLIYYDYFPRNVSSAIAGGIKRTLDERLEDQLGYFKSHPKSSLLKYGPTILKEIKDDCRNFPDQIIVKPIPFITLEFKDSIPFKLKIAFYLMCYYTKHNGLTEEGQKLYYERIFRLQMDSQVNAYKIFLFACDRHLSELYFANKVLERYSDRMDGKGTHKALGNDDYDSTYCELIQWLDEFVLRQGAKQRETEGEQTERGFSFINPLSLRCRRKFS